MWWLGDRGREWLSIVVGFSGGGGAKQNSRKRRTRRPRQPSCVKKSRMRGDVEVGELRWVGEVRSESGELTMVECCQVGRRSVRTGRVVNLLVADHGL